MCFEASTNHSCCSSEIQRSLTFPFPPPPALCASASYTKLPQTLGEGPTVHFMECVWRRSNTTPRAILHGRLGSCLKKAWHKSNKEASLWIRPMDFAPDSRHTWKHGHWMECLRVQREFKTLNYVRSRRIRLQLVCQWFEVVPQSVCLVEPSSSQQRANAFSIAISRSDCASQILHPSLRNSRVSEWLHACCVPSCSPYGIYPLFETAMPLRSEWYSWFTYASSTRSSALEDLLLFVKCVIASSSLSDDLDEMLS